MTTRPAQLSASVGYTLRQDHFNHQVDLLTSLLVMAWMVEARDPYTGGHLWRVSQFSRQLATSLGLPSADIARITVGGFLHDLGKISIPDHILGKRERLTEEEYDVIKTHPDVGWRMLAGHPLASLVESAVRAHHEMPDGKGYPRGLKGTEIPRDARIVGICDAFDAMTSTRPYRQGMPIQKALGIIEEQLGRQFDATFGEQFIQLGRAGQLDHIVGHSDEGIPLHECVVCGPTLVVTRDKSAGDSVFCRACSGEYRVEPSAGKMTLRATGRKAAAWELEPTADLQLISTIVRESARALAAHGSAG